jgi:hypothetical protein
MCTRCAHLDRLSRGGAARRCSIVGASLTFLARAASNAPMVSAPPNFPMTATIVCFQDRREPTFETRVPQILSFPRSQLSLLGGLIIWETSSGSALASDSPAKCAGRRLSEHLSTFADVVKLSRSSRIQAENRVSTLTPGGWRFSLEQPFLQFPSLPSFTGSPKQRPCTPAVKAYAIFNQRADPN